MARTAFWVSIHGAVENGIWRPGGQLFRFVFEEVLDFLQEFHGASAGLSGFFLADVPVIPLILEAEETSPMPVLLWCGDPVGRCARWVLGNPIGSRGW